MTATCDVCGVQAEPCEHGHVHGWAFCLDADRQLMVSLCPQCAHGDAVRMWLDTIELTS